MFDCDKIFANRSDDFNFLLRQILPIYDRFFITKSLWIEAIILIYFEKKNFLFHQILPILRQIFDCNKIFASRRDNFNFSLNSADLWLIVDSLQWNLCESRQILPIDDQSSFFNKIFASRSDNFNFSSNFSSNSDDLQSLFDKIQQNLYESKR